MPAILAERDLQLRRDASCAVARAREQDLRRRAAADSRGRDVDAGAQARVVQPARLRQVRGVRPHRVHGHRGLLVGGDHAEERER